LDEKSFGGPPKKPRRWFFAVRTPAFASLQVPHGFLVVLAGITGSLPWMPWRFNLRVLLIATTIVAVLLGAVVWRESQI
jgi:hypothetical protein